METSGRFQFDVKAAVRMLGRYLLPSADDAFLKLVQFGVSQSAQSIVLVSTPNGYLVHFLGLSEETPAAQMLSQMVEVLSGEMRDRRQPLFAGLNYFLHHGAEVALTVVQGGQVVDAARSADFPQQISKFPPDIRFPEALSLEFFARTVLEFDAHSLRQRLAYCPIPVTWKGKQLQGDREAAGCWPAYGKPLQQEFTSNGRKLPLEVKVEVKKLAASEYQGQAEVIPLQWGVALDPVPYSAGAPGIRLIVPANEVETQLGAYKMKPCAAWAEREGVVVSVLKSVTADVYGKTREAKNPRFRKPLSTTQAYTLKTLIVCAVFDLLIVCHKSLPSLGKSPDRALDTLQHYLPILIGAQILWILWQALI